MRMQFSLASLAALSLLAACGQPSQEPASAPAAATPAASAPPSPAAADVDVAALQAKLPAPFATADLANGKTKFALCRSCHTLNEGGASMTGPNLHGVFARKSGALESYSYSTALKTAALTWDATTMDQWLTDAKTLVPGNKMSFLGIKDAKDRTDLIAYLMVESGYAAAQ